MTDINEINETNETNETTDSMELSNMENPGQYVAAFFMIVKAGDPNVRHRDDKYIRETRFSPAGRHLAFINWQNPYGPDVQTFITVLYQNPGSSDFNVQLMAMPMPDREYRGYSGVLAEQRWDQKDYMKTVTRHLWNIYPGRATGPQRFVVNMSGRNIDIAMRAGNDLATASSNGPGEHQSALWKFNNDEKKLNLSMAKWGPFDYLLNIPSRDEMLSGNEYKDADFLSVTLNNMNLRGCNLPNANFTQSSIVNVKFDIGELPASNFSLDRDSFSPDMIMKDVWFNKTDLTGARFDKRPMEDCKFEKAILHGTSFKRTYFRNTSFKGADMARTDFSEVNFNGIVLDGTEKLGRTASTGTIFRGATIPYSMIAKDWQYLDLSDTKFTGTISAGVLQATGVKLIGTQLPGANFADANFTNADLSRANLAGADLTRANFTGANLTGTILTGAKLNNAIFTRTTLASAIMDEADLTGATFTDAPLFGRTTDNRTRLRRATVPLSFLGSNWSYLDLTQANLLNKNQLPENLNAAYVILDEVNLNDADLSGAILNYAQLKETQLPGADLTAAKMNNAVLIGTIFTNANMWQAEMANADITNADFTGAELWGAKATLAGATAVNVSFNHAYLANMDFSGIKGKSLQGCNFSDSCLVNAKFMDTTLGSFNGKVTSFANSCLQGANFSSAKLGEANLANASISTAQVSFKATMRDSVETLTASATTLPNAGDTSPRTVCPDGNSGPCSLQKWTAKTPQTTWSYRTFYQKAVG